jgi:hypothetical protein
LREKPSGIKQFLLQSLEEIWAALHKIGVVIFSTRSACSAYLRALCGEIAVTAEDRRDTQRDAEKTTFSRKEESAYLLRAMPICAIGSCGFNEKRQP